MTLSGATNPGQNGPGSDCNEGVLRIPQSFIPPETSPSDFFSVISRTLGGVLLLCIDTVGVFYSPSRLSSIYFEGVKYVCECVFMWEKKYYLCAKIVSG